MNEQTSSVDSQENRPREARSRVIALVWIALLLSGFSREASADIGPDPVDPCQRLELGAPCYQHGLLAGHCVETPPGNFPQRACRVDPPPSGSANPASSGVGVLPPSSSSSSTASPSRRGSCAIDASPADSGGFSTASCFALLMAGLAMARRTLRSRAERR